MQPVMKPPEQKHCDCCGQQFWPVDTPFDKAVYYEFAEVGDHLWKVCHACAAYVPAFGLMLYRVDLYKIDDLLTDGTYIGKFQGYYCNRQFIKIEWRGNVPLEIRWAVKRKGLCKVDPIGGVSHALHDHD